VQAVLHGGAHHSLPSFIAEIDADYLTGTPLPLGREPIFTVPLAHICRASIVKAAGNNLHLWALLCGCCFGERDRVLALELDAPAGWLHTGDSVLDRIAGSVRLGLFVRDAEQWVEAMGIRLLMDGM
jgi:hypothetical protein